MRREKSSQKVDALSQRGPGGIGRRDFGSEQLPTNTPANPWDVPSGPGMPPPSGQVAGESGSETPSDSGTGSSD